MPNKSLPWKDIAPGIRERMERSSDAQKVLAHRLGLSEPALSLYLTGKRSPSIGTLINVADFFKLPLDVLVGRDFGEVQSVAGKLDGSDRVLEGVGAPLVAKGVAAGAAAVPEAPDDRTYFFGESFMRRHGWRPGQKDRWCCIKLGTTRLASSMLPTIRPESVILVDRKASRETIQPRSLWFIQDPDPSLPEHGLCVKRVTVADGSLILESDNPDPQFAPRSIPLRGVPMEDVVKGKVVWWGTEAT